MPLLPGHYTQFYGILQTKSRASYMLNMSSISALFFVGCLCVWYVCGLVWVQVYVHACQCQRSMSGVFLTLHLIHYLMCMGVLSAACLCSCVSRNHACMYVWCSERLGSPGFVITDSCQPPCHHVGTENQNPVEQSVLLTAESSLQTLLYFLRFFYSIWGLLIQ